MIFIDAVNDRILPLGQQGEVNAVTVRFPISDWYAEYGEGGTFTLSNKRSCDPDGYECEVTTDDEYVYWTVSGEDASCKGKGRCELVYRKNGVVAKSKMYFTWVDPALNAEHTVPPAWEGWVSRLENKIDAAAEEVLAYSPDLEYSEYNVKKYVHDLQEGISDVQDDISEIQDTLPSLHNLFIAEYGITTAEAIHVALSENKTVILKVVGNDSSDVRFASLVSSNTLENEHKEFIFTSMLFEMPISVGMINEDIFTVNHDGWSVSRKSTYTTEVINAEVQRIAENWNNINTINNVDLPMIREYITIVPEEYTIEEWEQNDSISPYNYCSYVTAEYEIGSDTCVELINNNARMFSSYGFAIGDVSGQQITIYAIERPIVPVNLRIEYRR